MVDIVDDVDFLRLLPNFLVFVVVVLVDLEEEEDVEEVGRGGGGGSGENWGVVVVGVIEVSLVLVVVKFKLLLVANFWIWLGVFCVFGGGGGGVAESLDEQGEFNKEESLVAVEVANKSPPVFKAFLNLCFGVWYLRLILRLVGVVSQTIKEEFCAVLLYEEVEGLFEAFWELSSEASNNVWRFKEVSFADVSLSCDLFFDFDFLWCLCLCLPFKFSSFLWEFFLSLDFFSFLGFLTFSNFSNFSGFCTSDFRNCNFH